MSVAIKALVKTMDTTSPSPQKIEIVIISKDQHNEVKSKTLTEAEVLELLKKNGFN